MRSIYLDKKLVTAHLNRLTQKDLVTKKLCPKAKMER